MIDTDSDSGAWATECERRKHHRTMTVAEYRDRRDSLLAEADRLILWAIRPSGSGEPVPVMLERCYAWRRKYAKAGAAYEDGAA